MKRVTSGSRPHGGAGVEIGKRVPAQAQAFGFQILGPCLILRQHRFDQAAASSLVPVGAAGQARDFTRRRGRR